MGGDSDGASGTVQSLKVDLIKIDGGTQSRHAMCEDTISDYADALREGVEFPPVIVYFDGVKYWLADGFHRFLAHRRAELLKIRVEVRTGSKRDAILHAAGANAVHGLRRSAKDKRAAVRLLLRDDEWGAKTDRWIATKCAVGHGLVASVRSELRGSGPATEETRVARDGTTVTVTPVTPVRERESASEGERHTTNQDRRVAAQPLANEPPDDESADDDLDSTTEDDFLGNEDDPVKAGLADAKKFDVLIKKITSVYGEAKALSDSYGGVFLDDNKLAELRAKLQNAAQVLRDTKPHCECGYCNGNGVACRQCRSSGYLTKLLASDMPTAETAAV